MFERREVRTPERTSGEDKSKTDEPWRYLDSVMPGGCQVPWPGGRIEGGDSFGQ